MFMRFIMRIKKSYIGERPPLISRIKGVPYYTLRCPAECFQLVRDPPLISKLIFGTRGKEHI